jgi:hypothetical protein
MGRNKKESTNVFGARLTKAEEDRLEKARAIIQKRYPLGSKITFKNILMEGVEEIIKGGEK